MTASSITNVITRIQDAYPKLSPGFQKIAEYLISHHRDAAFLPAARMAVEVGVSESMVLRFAMELGFAGYSGLAKEIQNHVRERLLPSDRLYNLEELVDPDSISVRNGVLTRDELNLQVTATDYVNRNFSRVVAVLTSADRVFTLGLHGMSHMAALFGHLLDEKGVPATVLPRGDTALYHSLRRISKTDTLVAFAYSRYTQHTLDALVLARDRGATTISITDAYTSPPAVHSDLVLRAAVSSGSFIASHTAGVALIQVLANSVPRRYGPGSVLGVIPPEELLND